MNTARRTSLQPPEEQPLEIHPSMCNRSAPPLSPVNPMIETLHGVTLSDPYRWLEESNTPDTRRWLGNQRLYAQTHLNSLPHREAIRQRVDQMLSVETYGLPLKAGNLYFFLKRKPHQEQPSIYLREGAGGQDVLLVDPAHSGRGPYTSMAPEMVSASGRFLVYKVKEGGERNGSFKILDLASREVLPEHLPHGILRGFCFSEDETKVLYVHEPTETDMSGHCAAYQHILGTSFDQDAEVFYAGQDPRLRLLLAADGNRRYFIVYDTVDRTSDIYLSFSGDVPSSAAISCGVKNVLGFSMSGGRIFLLIETSAANRQITELVLDCAGKVSWRTVISESSGQIKSFVVRKDRLFVNYVEGGRSRVAILDQDGHALDEISHHEDGTAQFDLVNSDAKELFYSFETFTQPLKIFRYDLSTRERSLWAERNVPFDASTVVSVRVVYPSTDSAQIAMHLVATQGALKNGANAVILTGYGGFGSSATPKFGVLTSLMIEQGCIFALACLRGGAERGTAWHLAARGRNRQKAFDDFLAAAEWLIREGYATPETLAIFGGSNSGLLVGAAITQRPDLFRAAICLNPLLDMLRYHHFDSARKYCDEYGTADDADDFKALLAYSPYQKVEDGIPYPAVLFVSGDRDTNCNPMHARKMTARLQAASASGRPVILDYKPHRGHAPVMPRSERIEALTDRLSFLFNQLEIPFIGPEEIGG